MESQRRCSFCDRGERAVFRLIHGPRGLCICDRCVRVCNEILGDTRTLHELVRPRRAAKRGRWWGSGYRWRSVRGVAF